MDADRATFLSGANAGFIAELYARYLDDPGAVDASWAGFFAELGDDAGALSADRRGAGWAPPPPAMLGTGRGNGQAAARQATREKIVLCCGNVAGVAAVTDMMTVDQSQPAATYYTVVAGDNLSKISKANYGDPNKYMVIFEANKPMLSDPNKIYPGQVLRIPPL